LETKKKGKGRFKKCMFNKYLDAKKKLLLIHNTVPSSLLLKKEVCNYPYYIPSPLMTKNFVVILNTFALSFCRKKSP
jgi:hypothetical protein